MPCNIFRLRRVSLLYIFFLFYRFPSKRHTGNTRARGLQSVHEIFTDAVKKRETFNGPRVIIIIITRNSRRTKSSGTLRVYIPLFIRNIRKTLSGAWPKKKKQITRSKRTAVSVFAERKTERERIIKSAVCVPNFLRRTPGICFCK